MFYRLGKFVVAHAKLVLAAALAWSPPAPCWVSACSVNC